MAASYARGLVDRGVRVIDLSADFRLDSPEVYEEYYGNPHPDTALMQEAVYGLPEWRREEIARARIVASPGCYPTRKKKTHATVVGLEYVATDAITIASTSCT